MNKYDFLRLKEIDFNFGDILRQFLIIIHKISSFYLQFLLEKLLITILKKWIGVLTTYVKYTYFRWAHAKW